MKIVEICNLPPPFGGAEVFSRHLASHLADRGLDISIITQNLLEIQLDKNLEVLRYPYEKTYQSDLISKGIRIHPVFTTSFLFYSPHDNPGKPGQNTIQALSKVLQEEEADLIHCHSSVALLKEVIQAADDVQIPVMMTVHGMTTINPGPESNVTGGLDGGEIIPLLRRCTRVVVLSQEAADYCLSNGVTKVSRIPTGVDRNYFSCPEPSARRGILYVGKANRQKGIKPTLQAYLEIEPSNSEDLCLVGRGINFEFFKETGFYLSEIEKEAVLKYIQSGRIQLMGELLPSRIRDLYRTKRILVLPSQTEGFPLVILEALSCGMPVIASRVGAIPDVIRHGHNGYLISRGDAGELARMLVKSIELEGADRERICRDSTRDFEIGGIAESYIRTFRKIVTKSKSADKKSKAFPGWRRTELKRGKA